MQERRSPHRGRARPLHPAPARCPPPAARHPRLAPCAACVPAVQFKVADPTLADFGRAAIELAAAEMPGLLACREHWAAERPLEGAKVGRAGRAG